MTREEREVTQALYQEELLQNKKVIQAFSYRQESLLRFKESIVISQGDFANVQRAKIGSFTALKAYEKKNAVLHYYKTNTQSGMKTLGDVMVAGAYTKMIEKINRMLSQYTG